MQNQAINACASGKHAETRFVATPELKHHGKEICVLCGRFVRWVKKPENIERDAETLRRVTDLRGKSFLSRWEKTFIESISEQLPKLSPNQRDWLSNIWEKYSNV